MISGSPFKQIPYHQSIFVVLIYFLLLFIVDMTRILDIYDENFIRRVIHMIRRRDYLTYEKILDPYCEKISNMIDESSVNDLKNIHINEKKDMFWFSRQNTTSFYSFTQQDLSVIDRIELDILKKYEQIIGKKLYRIKSHQRKIYIYHGKNSKHLWHVDPNNVNSIYNAIVCFNKQGNISPFQYKDINGKIHSLHLEPSDVVLFNGGTTIHQVPPNNDPDSKRTVLSLAFTTDKVLAESNVRNLCGYIEGGNNYMRLVMLFLTIFCLNFIISYVSRTDKIDYTFLILFVLITFIIAKYIPMFNIKTMGSGRPSSFYVNLIILLLFISCTFSLTGGSLMFSYFVLSEVFFPSIWVAYN